MIPIRLTPCPETPRSAVVPTSGRGNGEVDARAQTAPVHEGSHPLLRVLRASTDSQPSSDEPARRVPTSPPHREPVRASDGVGG